MKQLAFLAALATPAAADYSDHEGVTRFTQMPCKDVIEILDNTPEPPADITLDTVYPTLQRITEGTAVLGMTWGFILGFDTARDGLQGDEQTTLIRLRKACTAAPDTPAADLLKSFN